MSEREEKSMKNAMSCSRVCGGSSAMCSAMLLMLPLQGTRASSAGDVDEDAR